ncbi:MAG: RsmB/NOP family class I SAM-dependent RNA methyltransferase, partial [Holophagales bacterium]|nr:RsmB/NOP family class I SAM-dependent RNA methyltransferase [Holophagales bacterium]
WDAERYDAQARFVSDLAGPAVALLDPRPGERLLDLCAAPGNKTAQAAVHMADTGTVVANDINHHRLGMVIRNVERLGLGHTLITHWNGANLPADTGKFHRVLADVPCSCEGTTRKNPEILWTEAPPQTVRWPRGQTALLRKAVERCRRGGRIVYSTCTYAPEENEAVVDAILGEFPDLRLLPIELPGFRFASGLTEWRGQTFRPELARALRAYPHDNDTGGFFVALLERQPREAACEGTEEEGLDPRIGAGLDPARRTGTVPPAPGSALEPVRDPDHDERRGPTPPALRGSFRRVDQVIDPVDGRPYLGLLENRFGIPRQVFAPYFCFRPTKDMLWLVAR